MKTVAFHRAWRPVFSVAVLTLCVYQPAQAQYTLLRTFGSTGTGSGQFNYNNTTNTGGPEDLALDSSGNIFVVDNGGNRVEEFSALTSPSSTSYVAQFGTAGTNTGQFNAPIGIHIDSANNIFVADTNNNRVQKFGSNLQFQTAFGSNAGSPATGQLTSPYDVVTDVAGNAYVSDFSNGVIQKFAPSGNNYTYASTITSADLKNPTKIAIDNSGNIFVSDPGQSAVVIYSSAGVRVGSLAAPVNGIFNPQGIAVDASGNVYVADLTNNVVDKFTKTGTTGFDYTLNTTIGAGSGFNGADGVALDLAGNVYVTDLRNNRVLVFAAAPVPEASTLLSLAGMAAGGIYALRRNRKLRKE